MRNIVILSLAGLLSALATSSLADDLVIAVAGPMTGPVASIGDQMKRGAEAAAAAINEAGGVNGRKIKIVVAGRRLRSQAGGRGREPHRRPGDQIRRRPRLLGIVDPGVRCLRREQRADDQPGLVEPGADREGPSRPSCASIRATTRKAPSSAPWIAESLQGQEDRRPSRQVGLRQGPRDGREGQAQRRRRHRGALRGHQPRREGLQRASSPS